MTNDIDAIKVNEKLTLYRRANSKRWQARLLLGNGEWHRFSTKTTDLDEAKDFALKQFYTADFRKSNNLPESTRKLRRVAMFTRNRMQEELDAGGGRVVYRDYISAIDRYLIPFFGNMDIAAISVHDLKEFDKFRTEKMGRKASHSTVNTHIFIEATDGVGDCECGVISAIKEYGDQSLNAIPVGVAVGKHSFLDIL